MQNNFFSSVLTLGIIMILSGCVGFSLPQPVQMKPYTAIKGGDQFGRDQLANRWLVAQKLAPLKGRDSRDILTFLGQPQQIEVIEHQVSENWYFIYYKNYKMKPLQEEGSFLVRFYNGAVIDVVNIN